MSVNDEPTKYRLDVRRLPGRGLYIGDLLPVKAEDVELTQSSSSIRIPTADTKWGAAMNETITDSNRKLAAEREPIGHFITYHMAEDIWDNWFKLVDPDQESPDTDLDRNLQKALKNVHAKKQFLRATEFERIYGLSILVGAFTDAKDMNDHRSELSEGSKLVDLYAYSKTEITQRKLEKDPNSLRYGLPREYWINRGPGKRLVVHWSRVYELSTRSNMESVLDPVYDDLTTYRNERYGLGQTLFRYGGGFPVIKLPKAFRNKLQSLQDEGQFADIMARTHIVMIDDMDLKFEGAAGVALNPEPYVDPVLESISAGCGVPEPVLRGHQAGALTGSEENTKQYFSVISSAQTDQEEMVRWVVDKLLEAGQVEGYAVKPTPQEKADKITARLKKSIRAAMALDQEPEEVKLPEYEIEWLGGFELTDVQKSQVNLYNEQANNLKLAYMTPDEVREQSEHKLKALPDGSGNVIRRPEPVMPVADMPGDETQITRNGILYIVKKITAENK